MKNLERKNFSVKEIVVNCASSFRDETIKEKYINSAEYIEQKSKEYVDVANNDNWSIISTHDTVNNLVTKDEMVKLYDQKFVKQIDVRQKYYDKIIATAKSGKCPICGIGQVSTLDHYLAKTLYPTYAVTPDNLIPICKDCNSSKRNKPIMSIQEAPFHPYFDEIDDVLWLCADVTYKNNILVAKYYVNTKINDKDSELYTRFCTHLDLYKLKNAYSVQASTEISENMGLWKKLYHQIGKQGLLHYLTECLESFETVQYNTWKTALFRGLINAVKDDKFNY